MPTYRLTIEYDGSMFSGWQAQAPGIRTVQEVLEDALFVLLKQRIRIQGAGRTDAGVHAKGQVASFVADAEMAPDRLRAGLSALARPDIAVTEARLVQDGFNARFDALSKRYRYCILNRKSTSPLLRRTHYHVPQLLSLGKMRQAAALLVGKHDFAGFRAQDCERENTIRELFEVNVREVPGAECIEIDVEGNGFLKNMVRIISGTLIDVGRGRLEPSVVSQILLHGDRRVAGPTAPAHGLVLLAVDYPSTPE